MGKRRLHGFFEKKNNVMLKISNRIDGDQIEFEWENFLRIHYIGNSRRDSKYDDWIKVWKWAIQRKDHLHFNVQWHCLGKTRERRKLYCECSRSCWVWSKIHARTLVIPGLGSEKKWYGSHVNKLDGEWHKTAEDMKLNFAESWTSYIPCYQRIRKRRIEKQRKRSEIHSLQR